MFEQDSKVAPDEAVAALDSVKKAEQAVLRRAVPPRWFSVALAVPSGIITILSGLHFSRAYMAPVFLIMVFVVVYQILKAGVVVKLPYPKPMIFAAFFSITGIYAALLLWIRHLHSTLGPWVAISFGVFIAVSIFIFSSLERKKWLFIMERNN